jgi:hypothetical protein
MFGYSCHTHIWAVARSSTITVSENNLSSK